MTELEGLGKPMDRVDKLELKTEFAREIDKIHVDLRSKADRAELVNISAEASRREVEQSERNRALKESVGAVERAVKALAEIVSQEAPATNRPRVSLRGIDPRILLLAGIAGGAAAGKSLELLAPVLFSGGS